MKQHSAPLVLESAVPHHSSSPLPPHVCVSLQEILGDREAGGITYYGVDMAEGTFGCRRLIREVICDFGWREDFAAAEAAALF